ncbi:MAG: DoxX family membrane protein [Desulfobulbus sp.]|nr:DoxX family membrane protein [Desulfobulbus sp.]
MITSKPTLLRHFPLSLNRGTIFRFIRWILALIFIYSGVVKLFDPPRFAQIMAGFGLLPTSFLMPIAILLPLAELVAGIGLFCNKRGSLTTIALMLVLFMAVLIYGIHLGLDIDCGCFGPEDPEQAYKGLKVALARDALMMVAVICLYWHERKGGKNKGRPESGA